MSECKKTEVYECGVCHGVELHSRSEFIDHMLTAHYISRQTQGTRSMTLHLDCADHHVTSYQYEYGGIKAVSSITVERESARKRRELKEKHEKR